MRAPHILVAADERSIRLMLETGLSLNGFRVTCVRTRRQAIEAAACEAFDAVLTDIDMGETGHDLAGELRAANPTVPIVLMTAQGSLDAAIEAVSRGVSDFIGKPFEIAEVVSRLRRFLAVRREAAARQEEQPPECDLAPAGLIGRSAPMVLVYKLTAQAARIDATVLITGESGTGKELAARSIHDYSARAARPFVSVNCSGVTDTLLESELFGHTRGAFTGAVVERGGLFEAAEGGTLFLDELASASAAFQASLLRVLQSGEVRRVGATQTSHVNVRVIGASNAPLRQLVEAGSFRADLYYRLSVFGIDLPPLRARMEDLPLLTAHFLQRFGDPHNPPHLSREAAEAMAAYSYPGNVRELENALRRALALCSNGLITIDCFPPEIANAQSRGEFGVETEHRLIADRPCMGELQRRYLELILAETGWNRRRAAAVLNLDRRTIQRLIARYRLRGAFTPKAEPDLDQAQEALAG